MRFPRVAAATAVVVAVLAAPAVASAAPSISINPTGQLGPEGATAVLSVTATCDPGFEAYGFVSLAQSSGKRLAQGSGYFDSFGGGLVCDGTPHVVQVTVSNSFQVFPYKNGNATASAQFFEYGPTGSFTATAGPQAVRLRK